jgi:L-threonate 2-dehydrogenase
MGRKTTIAVFGLGSMGSGIASSILKSGFETWGFDSAKEVVERFVMQGGLSGDIQTVAKQVDIAVIVVLNAEQTESVLFGEDGIVRNMPAGSCVIACATAAPDFARSMAMRCLEHNVHYLDAPISGGSIKAAAGQLTVMSSGTDESFAAAQPVLDAMSEKVFRLGSKSGMGSAMKSVNQLLAGVHIASMAEALTFGISQGMDAAQIVEVISECAGSSWMFKNRAPHVVDGDYTPHSSVNIWLKDLGIVQQIAKSSGVETPLTESALRQFIAAADAGLGTQDDAAVTKIYARQANVKLPGE